MSKAKSFDELTDADLERIRLETLARDAAEPRAHAVRYDRKKDQVVVELKNGVVLAVPTRLLQGVAGADPQLIAKVETDARGYGLHWEELDADLSVSGLLSGCFGSGRWMNKLRADGELPTAPTAAEAGRKGGSASTPIKRTASRANGKLGGRPRKKVTA